jgi:uncharacterized membrane protein HdeD (DUF308 family)
VSIILVKNWWSLVIRGLAAVSLGVITLMWHEITLPDVAVLFSGYAAIDGLVSLAGALRAAETHLRWGVLVCEGLAGIGAAIITFAWPSPTELSLAYIIAAWALLTGVLEIGAAIRLRRYIAGEWMLAFGGAASLALGILMIAIPLAGSLSIATWLAVYALVFGALLIVLGLRLRSWMRELNSSGHARSADARA